MERVKMKRFVAIWALAACAVSVGCSDDEPPLPQSLASPAGVAVARSCRGTLGGASVRTLPERCDEGGDVTDGTVTSTGLIANRERESLVFVDLSLTVPQLVDLNRGEPGVTGITVCEGPQEVQVTPDGVLALVQCDLGGELVIVSVPDREVVFSRQSESLVSDLVVAPDDTVLATLRPLESSLVLERITYDCGVEEGTYVEDCIVEPALEEIAAIALPGTPSALAYGPEGALFVTYTDRTYLSRFTTDGACADEGATAPCEAARIGLVAECGDGVDNDGDGNIDQEDLQCYGPDGAESPDGIRGRATLCTDGLDNDEDGLVDHDDADCLAAIDNSEGGGVAPTECADGLDNDGDGQVDGDDSECAEDWPLERAAACSDGIDGDGDELIDFPDDPECASALWDDEATAFDAEATECTNGIDDDGDGFADLADPGCGNVADSSEQAAAPVCSDGADNDGDGLADGADPDCYGAAGSSEEPLSEEGFGPVSVQTNGRYALVVDPIRHQLLVIDPTLDQLLDAGADDPVHSGLGIPFSSSSVANAAVGYTLDADLSSGDLEAGLEQELAVLPTSNGLGTALSLSITHFEVVDGERTEGFDTPLRPQDGDGEHARVSEASCEFSDEYRDAVRAARGVETDLRINCEDDDVPQIQVDEDGVAVTLAQEARFTVEDGVLVEESVPFDYHLRDEIWTLTYEGALPDSLRTDGIIDADEPGLLVPAGGNFCTLGVVPGDHLIITESTPSLDGEEGACDAFSAAELEYTVELVRSDGVRLALTGEEGHAEQLPNRECFAEGFEYEVRASESWLVVGSTSDLLHDQVALSEQCVSETGNELLTGRLTASEPFQNVAFSLVLAGGDVPATRDVQLFFDVQNHFATTAISIGPHPTGAVVGAVGTGRRLLISDGGISTVQVFDAESLILLTTLF